MEFRYETSGTCATEILVDIKEDSKTINKVQFLGGCNGNLKGISSLVKGKTIDEVIHALKGIKCGFKKTSCPDQLAKALENIKEEL
ncbi:MAG: TIGR03905 family TSCPD domain-containing protein [Eubacterium sp.]